MILFNDKRKNLIISKYLKRENEIFMTLKININLYHKKFEGVLSNLIFIIIIIIDILNF